MVEFYIPRVQEVIGQCIIWIGITTMVTGYFTTLEECLDNLLEEFRMWLPPFATSLPFSSLSNRSQNPLLHLTFELQISLYLIVPNDALEEEINRVIKSKAIANFVTDVLGYFIMSMIFLTLSYFVFGILLNILWLTLYFVLVDKVLDFAYNKLSLN